MRQQPLVRAEWGYLPCRYGSSRLLFRGPPRPLDGRHVAVLGGSETIGRRVAEPFPALLERELGETVINFGQANASVQVFQHDPLVPRACADAALTVIAVMGAQNLSNRLYTVHPRRNDRFLRASAQLRDLYPQVDFTEICFTRHLLMTLWAAAPQRFDVVREELGVAWLARMRTFIDRLGPRVLLLWFAAHPPPEEERPEEEGPEEEGAGPQDPLGHDPLFVSRPMLESLRPVVCGIMEVPPAPPGEEAEAAHRRAAAALLGPLRALLPPREAVRASR